MGLPSSFVSASSNLLSKFCTRASNLWTFWMGHGHLKCRPGAKVSGEALPKVVRKATSFFRTWKKKSSTTKTASKRPPMTTVR